MDTEQAIGAGRPAGVLPLVSAAWEHQLPVRVLQHLFWRPGSRWPAFLAGIKRPILRPAGSALVVNVDLSSTCRAKTQVVILSSFLHVSGSEEGNVLHPGRITASHFMI